MPVAAVADTVATSIILEVFKSAFDVVPTNVCKPVNEFATLVTGMFAPAREVAPVPPLETASVPVTPVDSGKPVALVNVTDVGVPNNGVTSVGLVDKTTEPVPVEVVTPVPPFVTAKVPANVTAPLVAVDGVNPVVPAEKVVTGEAALL